MLRKSLLLVVFASLCSICVVMPQVCVASSNAYNMQNDIRIMQGPSGPGGLVVTFTSTDISGWTAAQVNLDVISNGVGDLLVNVTSTDGAFVPVFRDRVTFGLGPNRYNVTASSAWGTLPGTYAIKVEVWYVNASDGDNLVPMLSGDVTVHLTLGITIGIPIIVGILAVGVLFIVKFAKSPKGKKKTDKKADKKSETSDAASPKPSSAPEKIPCPECKKMIDDGSAFCAECGAHIPEFLRHKVDES